MLDKSILHQILKDWSFWNKSPQKSIPRKILSKGLTLSADLVLAIQGVRRCGKSTLLSQIMKQQKLDPKACTFVNFEDPRLTQNLNTALLDKIVSLSKELYPNHRKYYFFLDEIQNIPQWEKWLNAKVERSKNEIYVITGSNASLLSGELATALTGRHITLELFPFDYSEFKQLKKKGSFQDYLKEGGFPRVLSFKDSQELLREYFTDIIEKDVRRHISARSSLTLTQLIKAVYESSGSEVSLRTLAKMIDVTADTVKTYLDAACTAYMLMPCSYFTFSEKQRAARNKKYYPIDLGMRKAIISQTGYDMGKDLETVVFHHLRKKYKNVFYWRGEGEVDFIIHDKEGIIPIQVSWDTPKERHFKALKEFKEKFHSSQDPIFISRENIIKFLES